MKNFLSMVAFAFLFCDTKSYGKIIAPDNYIASSVETLASNIDLISACKSLNETFMECSWVAQYPIASGEEAESFLPEGFRQSVGSKIEISGDISETDGGFSLAIDEVSYPLKDNIAVQEFPLPVMGSKNVKVYITSGYSGRGDVSKNYRAKIKEIRLIKDNSWVVKRTLENAKAQIENIDNAIKEYLRQKKFVEFLKLSDQNIKTIKEALTNRNGDDLTDDCNVDGKHNAAPLGPADCELLKHLNQILRREPTDVDEETKEASFENLLFETNTLRKFQDWLTMAKLDYKNVVDQSLQRALSIIKGDNHD